MQRRKRVFAQERAKKTYEAILRAAVKVFPKRGFAKTQVPDIARAAGVSTGAVYRYFRDKREIFLEMLDDHLAEVRAEVERRLVSGGFTGDDPRAAIDAVLEVFFVRAKEDTALTRVYLAMSLTDPDVGELRARAEAADRELLAAMLAAAFPRERVPDPAASALVTQVAAIAIAAEFAIGRPGPVTEAAAKAAFAGLLHRYFFADAG